MHTSHDELSAIIHTYVSTTHLHILIHKVMDYAHRSDDITFFLVLNMIRQSPPSLAEDCYFICTYMTTINYLKN